MSDKRFFRIPHQDLDESYVGGPPIFQEYDSFRIYINSEVKRITKKTIKWKKSGKNSNIIFCFDNLSKTNSSLLTLLANELKKYEQ